MVELESEPRQIYSSIHGLLSSSLVMYYLCDFLLIADYLASEFSLKSVQGNVRILERPGRTTESGTLDSMLV